MKRSVSSDVVVLDFDGTIVDSMPFLTSVATSLLAGRYDIDPQKAYQAYVETCGLPFSRQIGIIFPGDGRNPSTVKVFEGQKRQRLMDFRLFPDVLPAVAEIRRHGIKVCVSSGNAEDLIGRFLRLKNLEVDLVMGYRQGFEKGPDHFEFATRTFGSSLERLVFVGDSRMDGLTARRVGIRFIARTGLLSAEELSLLLPGVPVVDSLEEILPLIGIRRAQGV